MTFRSILLALCFALSSMASTARQPVQATVPTSGVLGVTAAQMTPGFWITRASHTDRVLMNKVAIVQQNARLFASDRSVHDLREIPRTLTRAQIREWITSVSVTPQHTRYDRDGHAIAEAALVELAKTLNLDAIPAQQTTRYGLVVHRANLRTFPSAIRAFSEPDNTDIDRFQETGLFPGTPVVIAHVSGDGQWLFVVSPRYAAWIKKTAVAEGDAKTVLAYHSGSAARVITGAQARTVFTPETPALSELRLDMGLHLPLARGLEPGQPVNGQSAYASWALLLPTRMDDGKLALKPALLQRVADSRGSYLPLTRANIIAQAFKFLGERYGWGHMYNGRDCSGFVSEVYRSMG
ncbi:MAG: SH3 domain-containing protein, partial [Rhodanobacteraceae bacterium]